MGIITNLLNYFTPSDSQNPETPDGLCPNCWGNQEYDNIIREMYEDKQIDVNNKEANHAFIQEFVVNRVSGITLKKGANGYTCPTCKIVS
jgi:hypothetical protein